MSAAPLYPYAGWTDEALLPALAANDQPARAEIYARYWHRVFILAYRHLKLRETAVELVQDLFTVLWHRRAAHAFQHLAHYWLAAIGQWVLGYLRAHPVREAYADYCRWHEATTHGIERPLAVAGLTKAVSNALRCLPEPLREVLRLSWFEHFSIPELVQQLNLAGKLPFRAHLMLTFAKFSAVLQRYLTGHSLPSEPQLANCQC